MSMQRDRRRQQIQDGSTTSAAKRKSSPFKQDGNSQGGKRMKYSMPALSEDIYFHIYSLMPMRDAARAACVSRAFLRSWRCHPNLTFSRKTLGMNSDVCGKDEIPRDLTSEVDHILKKHSGIGVKKLKFDFYGYNAKACNLDRWLESTVTPGIEELTVELSSKQKKYNFPWSLLSDGRGKSIRHLNLCWCIFRPTVGLGLRSLTGLHLCYVCITGGELSCLLDNSFALQKLELRYCSKIVRLRIPCLLQHLSYLEVAGCERLRVIESKAQHLSNFRVVGDHQVQISLGEASQLKVVEVAFRGAICYARADLPSSSPNLESLAIRSYREMVSTPMVPSKFFLLKHLRIDFGALTFNCPAYDFCSLISFFDACPSLESFILNVMGRNMQHPSIFADPSALRKMPEHRHDKLKSVKIIGFSSAKSLVELACHILQSTRSLECLALDTTEGHPFPRCSDDSRFGECIPFPRDSILEARQALLAIRRYIERNVPSQVKLTIVEPCSRCHVV